MKKNYPPKGEFYMYQQYDSIEAGIKAHAETYSFNIESELFHQLTKEQQALWRKEIEQAIISGGHAGVELARDPRYEENLEVKEVEEPNASDRGMAEETIKEVCEWLDDELCCYIKAQDFTIDHARLNKDLRKHLEGEI